MSEWVMDNEQPHQELVKCVVVGDTAVGKTRLICARACNKQVSLGQLLSTHVPTVWAIDQYRIYKDVLERSWEVVDGVSVSLRLWDTFGDHEKDRRFAYGRSDVVLLCFSVGNPVSLRNCKAMWLPEIRRFCPNTPVILVGCKNDLRYMYRDETYLSYFKDRSPFVRPTRECDIVMPDQARALANELDVPYFEASVLTYYGVTAVFENVIRAALVARKQQRFWVAGLKRVQRPILQAPFCPPKPRPCEVYVSMSSLTEHLQNLYSRQAFTDVIFVTGSVGFSAHKFWLAVAAPSLHRLLDVEPTSVDMGTRSSSESSILKSDTSQLSKLIIQLQELIQMSTFGESTAGNFNDDTECLIEVDNLQGPRLPRLRDNKDIWKRRFSCHVAPAPWDVSISSSSSDHTKTNFSKVLSHPAAESVSLEQCEGLDHRGKPCISQQTVVHLSKLVSPSAMRQCLRFVYTGSIDTRYGSLQDLRQAAEFLELPELLAFTANIQNREEFLNNDVRYQYRQAIKRRLLDICLSQFMYADVRFLLDDGTCPAHRAMVMARCDVLNAMFSGDFRESSAKVVEFPGVKTDTFRQLLHYLYTDGVPASLQPSTCLPLIELANRLCLPRLVQLVESQVVQEMQRVCELGGEVMFECINLLEPCQIHNADQLADWCLTYMASNYNTICRKAPKLLKAMHTENQAYLARHRWPPVWYLKDRDYYEKCVRQREREENGDKPLKRSRHNSGCLCFTGKSRRSDDVAYHSV